MRGRHVDTIEALIRCGADVKAESGNGERALAFASRAGHSNAVSVIQSAMKLSVVLGRGHVAACEPTTAHGRSWPLMAAHGLDEQFRRSNCPCSTPPPFRVAGSANAAPTPDVCHESRCTSRPRHGPPRGTVPPAAAQGHPAGFLRKQPVGTVTCGVGLAFSASGRPSTCWPLECSGCGAPPGSGASRRGRESGAGTPPPSRRPCCQCRT
jgi:hypothetical protein